MNCPEEFKMQAQMIFYTLIITTKEAVSKTKEGLLGQDSPLFPGSSITYLQKMLFLVQFKLKGKSWTDIQDMLDDNNATLPQPHSLPKDVRTFKSRVSKLFSFWEKIELILCEKSMFRLLFCD